MPDSSPAFFADEEPEWEPYAENEKEAEEMETEFDEEYQRYLDEMAEALMNDKNLRAEVIKELSTIESEAELSKEDSELLKLAHRFEEEDMRTELEEQERQMVEKQRRMARRENEHDLDIPIEADEYDFHDADQELWDDPEKHKEELRKIAMQRVKMLTNIDGNHNLAFIQKEMERELRFREELTKEQSQEKRDAMLKAHKDDLAALKAAHGHHPGSQKQLEEVWRNGDDMKDSAFDPAIFFHLHDLNGDGSLDIKELEAIFYAEARKLHEIRGNVDELAVLEEMRRMRRHVVGEMDTDQDGLISFEEFTAMTKKPEFNSDPTWSALVPDFNEETLKQFESRRRAARQKDRLWQDKGEHIDHALIEATRRLELQLWRQQRTHNLTKFGDIAGAPVVDRVRPVPLHMGGDGVVKVGERVENVNQDPQHPNLTDAQKAAEAAVAAAVGAGAAAAAAEHKPADAAAGEHKPAEHAAAPVAADAAHAAPAAAHAQAADAHAAPVEHKPAEAAHVDAAHPPAAAAAAAAAEHKPADAAHEPAKAADAVHAEPAKAADAHAAPAEAAKPADAAAEHKPADAAHPPAAADAAHPAAAAAAAVDVAHAKAAEPAATH